MKFLKLKEVLEMTGRSRTATYDDIAQGKFPAQVKVGASSFWLLEEIEAWMQSQIANRSNGQ